MSQKSKVASKEGQEREVRLTVAWNEPTLYPEGQYAVDFWLRLRVDDGSRVVFGTSDEHTVEIQENSLGYARRAAAIIGQAAEKRVENMDIIEAMLQFPFIIEELAHQGEGGVK